MHPSSNNLQNIESTLISITEELLKESNEGLMRHVSLEASLQSHLGIDSLTRAELFQRIEKTFNVHLSDQLLMQADTLADIANYLKTTEAKSFHFISPQKIIQHGERVRADVNSMKTLIDILLFYGMNAKDQPHIYFQQENGSEIIITYGSLLHHALCLANGLRIQGIKEGDCVAIMQPTCPEFFYSFYGILLAGGIPVPIYPPFRMQALEAYAKTEAGILRNAEVRMLITFKEAKTLSQLLKNFVPSLKWVGTVSELMNEVELLTPYQATEDKIAFIQYTSGSTAAPKGVTLTHYNLLSNIKAYGMAIKVKPEDVSVSWLPLYHDMGLIGMWLGSLSYGVPLVLLTPFTFLNHPERWLWAIHYHRGTLSGAPNFAYELCVRKIENAQIEGLDLSSWRMAANGAEKVYPRTLERFATRFAPYGFKKSTLLPVYGLAETAVALLIPPLEKDYRIDKIARQPFEEQLLAEPTDSKNALEFVSCGSPLPGHLVRIVDDKNKVLPERRVGHLQFKGPSSMQGYYRDIEATEAVYHEGWIDSGDLAYEVNGEFYITGRKKDVIIKAGRNIYPAEIEELVSNIPDIRKGCVIAFGIVDTENLTEKLIIVAESRVEESKEREHLIQSINEKIATNLDLTADQIVIVPPQTVPKTSSGKLQRAACKKMYLSNQLEKSRKPAWWQIVKLTTYSMRNKIFSLLKNLSKWIFTLYVILILTLLLTPLFLLTFISTRAFFAKTAQVFAKIILILCFCPIRFVGKSNLFKHSQMIFVSNHASYLDALVLLAILPTGVRFVGKQELLSVPILKTFFKKLDYVILNRLDWSKGLDEIESIQTLLKQGSSIVIFPEGTFGYASGLRPFRLGAFKIAAVTKTPICPIVLNGTRSILRAEEFLLKPGKIKVIVSEPIEAEEATWEGINQLRQHVREVMIKHCDEPALDFIIPQVIAPKKQE